MNYLKASLVLIWIFPLCCLAEYETIDCSEVPKNYQNLLNEIKTNCQSSTECQLSHVDWDLCKPAITHSNSDYIKKLIKNRDNLHKTCNYIPKPCHFAENREPEQIACINYTCQRISTLDAIGKEKLKFIF